jgi:Thymidylate synthase
MVRTFKTPSEAYFGALREVYEQPDVKSSPRGQPCREKLDYTFRVMEPCASPIVTKDEERNRVIASYTAKEVALYNSCSNSAEDFGKASKFWLNLANPDGTVNSAYGHLIWGNRSHGSKFESSLEDMSAFWGKSLGSISRTVPKMRTPWEWAKESLIKDKDTRQAVLRFSLPEHFWIGNKDFVCTLHGNFLIREDKLHFSVVMRSNDLTLGLVYDLPWFCSLMDKMVEELKPHYPNLTKGHYTHTVHSLHIYDRNEDTVKKMLGLN